MARAQESEQGFTVSPAWRSFPFACKEGLHVFRMVAWLVFGVGNPLVVFAPFFRIGQYRVGGIDDLYHTYRLGTVAVTIRMVFLRQRFIRRSDNFRRSIARDFQIVVMRMDRDHHRLLDKR